MIKHFFNIVICKTKGHTLITAGSCPFTGKTYNACTKCGAMIAI
jgi:hypothetical protein